MAQNFIESGERLDYICATGETIASGQIVQKGALVGVSLNSGVEGSIATIALEGVFEVPKVTGNGTGMTLGQKLYYNLDGKMTTAVDNGGSPATPYVFAGFVWKAANTTATTVQCKLAYS